MTFDYEAFIADAIKNSPIEAKIIRKVIRTLKAAGTPVAFVYDQVEMVRVTSEKEILENVFNLDESWLMTEYGSWVRLALGNEQDVITDYTVDLEDTLEPVNEYIMKNWD